MDPRAHHQAIARAVRIRRRGRALPPRVITSGEPIDARRPRPEHGKAKILPIDPTAPRDAVIDEVRAALNAAARAVVCVTCDRRLCRPERGARPTVIFDNGAPLLAEEDWCRWCARPISERGERLAPKEGFLQVVLAAALRAPAAAVAPREAQA